VEVSEDEENDEKSGTKSDDLVEDEDQVEEDDDDYPRKSASFNSCDNGIGLDPISEDSCLNEEL